MQNYESTYDLTRIISIDISLIVGLKDLLLAHNRRNIRVLVTRVNIDFYRLFFNLYWNQILLKSTDAATVGVLWTRLFLKISQNSRENACIGVSFLIKLQALGLQHRCFPVNFVKFLRTTFL